MNVIVNGNPTPLAGTPSVADLLQTLKTPPDHVAVAVNEAIIVKADRATTVLAEGDVVEILVLAGGG